MIRALRYEPQGQRQRFEPREQQRGEQQEQDRHIHLHLHLNFTFRARQGRSTHPNAVRFTRIFAALVGATVIPLWLFGASAQEGVTPTLSMLAGIFLAGLALAWGCGCLPLLVSAWRSTPRVRFLLLVLPLVISLTLFPGLWLFPIMHLLEILRILRIGPGFLFLLLLLLLYVHPLISAILLASVNREARALRQTGTAHSWLSFVIVSGMALMLLGGLLLNLSLMLSSGPPLQPLLFLPAMCGAVIVAIYTLFGLFRSRESMQAQARPKDADVDSSQEPGGDRG
jgi:hypothetical protein